MLDDAEELRNHQRGTGRGVTGRCAFATDFHYRSHRDWGALIGQAVGQRIARYALGHALRPVNR